VTDKYNKWLQLVKQIKEDLFIYPSTFRNMGAPNLLLDPGAI